MEAASITEVLHKVAAEVQPRFERELCVGFQESDLGVFPDVFYIGERPSLLKRILTLGFAEMDAVMTIMKGGGCGWLYDQRAKDASERHLRAYAKEHKTTPISLIKTERLDESRDYC